jgi:hypothetical protein
MTRRSLLPARFRDSRASVSEATEQVRPTYLVVSPIYVPETVRGRTRAAQPDLGKAAMKIPFVSIPGRELEGTCDAVFRKLLAPRRIRADRRWRTSTPHNLEHRTLQRDELRIVESDGKVGLYKLMN